MIEEKGGDLQRKMKKEELIKQWFQYWDGENSIDGFRACPTLILKIFPPGQIEKVFVNCRGTSFNVKCAGLNSFCLHELSLMVEFEWTSNGIRSIKR